MILKHFGEDSYLVVFTTGVRQYPSLTKCVMFPACKPFQWQTKEQETLAEE